MPSVRSAVWSCMRPGRNAPAHRVRPCPSVTTVAFFVFIFFLPDTNARRPGLPARGAADLDLGPVDPQFHAAGGGVGEHVGQGAQPQARMGGDGEPAGRQQRADLLDGAGDGRAVDPA